MSEKRLLDVVVEQQKTQLQGAEQELLRVVAAAEIDRHSLKQVHKSLARLQSTLASSEEELWLYRHLLQDKAGGEGPFNSTLKLQAGEADEIVYKLLIYRKRSKQNKDITVNYLLTVKGSGEDFTVDAESVGAQKATFKYFHVVEGDFRLPQGFTPEALEIRIWKEQDAVTTQVFPWEVN